MHLVIPFAALLSDAGPLQGASVLRSLAWPVLSRQLAGLPQPQRDAGDEWSLTPPHERALAAALGWQGSDGLWPFAAAQALADGVSGAKDAQFGLVTPVHWHLGTEQISMGDPEALLLDQTASRETLAAVRELFTSEGFALHYGAPWRWYLEHPSLARLPSASLDRVIGRNVDRWLESAREMRLLRRLQNEVQMLLYEHPINRRREAQGLLAINSFWLSGTGATQPASAAMPRLDTRLRHAALANDEAAWAKAWAVIDGELSEIAWQRLTLCGERSSLTWDRGAASSSWWKSTTARWRSVDVASLLATL